MSTKRAFSAVTLSSAKVLHRALGAAAASGSAGVIFQGAWVRRRLLIVGGRAAQALPAHGCDPLALTITVPATSTPDDLMRQLRSFGGVVERVWRDSVKGHFDLVVSDSDAARHLVHQFHHVALCGHKAQRWLTDDEVSGFAGEVKTCPQCTITAATKPNYRARWHPLAAEIDRDRRGDPQCLPTHAADLRGQLGTAAGADLGTTLAGTAYPMGSDQNLTVT